MLRIFTIILCIFLCFSPLADALSISGESREEKPQEKKEATRNFVPILSLGRHTLGESDSTREKFVSKYQSLDNREYAPDDLESISGSHIDMAGRNVFLRKEALVSLRKLAWTFEETFGTPLVVISGYRSASYQQRMWDLGKCSDTLCAPPGYSEHQLWLAMDIFDATTESEYEKNARYRRYIGWMQANAHLYGWTQSYQNGEYIDAYEVEPWHWRYLWVDLATKLKGLNMSYTEYVRIQGVLRWYWFLVF